MTARRENFKYHERIVVDFDHAQVTGTTTWKIWKVPAGRDFRVDSVQYINVTGLAADTTNAYTGVVKNGSTVVATVFDTDSDTGAALTANTFVDGVLSATDANTVLTAGDILSFVATKGGTQTLPAGRIVVEGRYV